MLVARYVSESGNKNDVVADVTLENKGMFHVILNPKTDLYDCGYFENRKATERYIEQTEPTAKKLNVMCAKCIEDCPGTCCQLWTGCVNRQTD